MSDNPIYLGKDKKSHEVWAWPPTVDYPDLFSPFQMGEHAYISTRRYLKARHFSVGMGLSKSEVAAKLGIEDIQGYDNLSIDWTILIRNKRWWRKDWPTGTKEHVIYVAIKSIVCYYPNARNGDGTDAVDHHIGLSIDPPPSPSIEELIKANLEKAVKSSKNSLYQKQIVKDELDDILLQVPLITGLANKLQSEIEKETRRTVLSHP